MATIFPHRGHSDKRAELVSVLRNLLAKKALLFVSFQLDYFLIMPKQKNTNNKKKHSKLLDQKKSKKREEKEMRAKALKELVSKMNKANKE